MPWLLIYAPRAVRDLKKLPRDACIRIVAALEDLAGREEPETHAKHLQNSPLYSLRVGRYRVILNIQRKKIVIFILRAGIRGWVYDRL
jgi:mRNA interferase RelE/StbE